MRSPVQALIWEQWRQVRLPIAFGFVLTVASSWSVHFAMAVALQSMGSPRWSMNDANDWAESSTVMVGIALVLVMASLLFAHSSPRDLRMGLPSRMLTLPISPKRIAAAQIGFRFVVVGLVSLVFGLSLTAIDSVYADYVLPVFGVSVLCYSYASAVAVTVGRRNPVVAFVTIILTISPVIATVDAIHNQFTSILDIEFAVFYVFVAVCAAVSFVSIARVRNAPRVDVRLYVRVRPRSEANVRPGADTSARFMYEWRRIGWMVPCFTAALAVLGGLPLVVLGWKQLNVFHVAGGLAALSAYGPPIVAVVIGTILIVREHRDSVMGVARFAWTRPVTVQQVVLDRMKAAAFSMLLTYAALGVLTVAAVYLLGERIPSLIVQNTGFMVLGYLGILLLTWCVIWVPYVPVAYWIIFVLYTASSDYYGAWGNYEDFWLIWVPESLFLLATLALAHHCWKRQIFRSRVLHSFALFCGVTCAAAIWGLYNYESLDPGQSWTDIRSLSAAVVLSLMPLFALLSQGVFLDRVRHGALLRRLPAREK